MPQNNEWIGLIVLFIVVALVFPALAIYFLQSVLLIVIIAIVLAAIIIVVILWIKSNEGAGI